MFAKPGGWAAALLGASLLATACGTPPPNGEQLPPVGIRSSSEATEPPTDDDVFVDRRTSTWPTETSDGAIVDPAVPAEPSADRVVVPATTVAPAALPVPTAPTAELEPASAPVGTVSPATPNRAGPGVPTARPTAVPVGSGVVPAWPQYTTRPGLTGVAALTGWPAPAEVTAAPVLAVKIDNERGARPQWQLEHADVVFEENIEARTRFLALFHSDVPAEIGPIRSARTTDIDLLAAMNRPVLAWSGGNPGVTRWVDAAADAGLVNEVAAVRSSCYRRESSRRAPNNLVASTSCVLERGAGAGPAVQLWTIDATWTPTPATAARVVDDTSFEIRMDGLRVGWSWDAANRVYVRSQNGGGHLAASGARISAANVVVLTAPHAPSAVDARSPHASTVGSGPGVVHRDGQAIAVTWHRPTSTSPFEFLAEDGSRVALQVGRTFVELAR